MAITEHTINDALAEVLMETRSLWRFRGVVRSENTDVLKGSTKGPDILVTEPHVSAVVVETEIMLAVSVESDARQRPGLRLAVSGRPIMSSLAVRLPARRRDSLGADVEERGFQCSRR